MGEVEWPYGLTRDNWMYHEKNAWAFQNISSFCDVFDIGRGHGPVDRFEYSPELDDNFQITKQVKLSQFLEDTQTDAFLVMRDNKVIYERYFGDMTENQLHLLFSISKSVTAALCAILQWEGLIDPEKKVQDYLPDLPKESGFFNAHIQDLLDMCVGVKFEEDSVDPNCERIRRYATYWGGVEGGQPVPGYRSWLLNLPPEGTHGGHFSYKTACTDVLGLVIEAAGGGRFSDLLSEKLWSRLGMECDAHVVREAGGISMAGSGISLTLRDMARFGKFLMRGGKTFQGRQLFAPDWIARTHNEGDQEAFNKAYEGDPEAYLYPGFSYRNCLWNRPDEYGGFLCIGIFGQWLYMAPKENFLIAKFSSYPLAKNEKARALTYQAIETLTNTFCR